ncbi:MAG: helix-turn-helix transcriptional regulator [Magnetococcales bacterium]|nr:helix-turn-helix transcriptional regulator [Magnetococcales bacterium]
MHRKQPIPGFNQRLMRIIGQEAPFVWAARFGIAKATMYGLLRNASPTTATLMKIAQKSDVSISWLLTGEGAERVVSFRTGRVDEGSERHFQAPEGLQPRSWMGEIEGYVGLSVRGDGMEPLLRDGDWVWFDRTINRFAGDGIYIVHSDGFMLPKRFQNTLDGLVQIGHDNPAYKNRRVALSELDHVEIAGRVVWIGRRI